jgi:hypothetical protein
MEYVVWLRNIYPEIRILGVKSRYKYNALPGFLFSKLNMQVTVAGSS